MNKTDSSSVAIVTELTGSVGVYASNLITGLLERGVDVSVITPQPENSPTTNTIPVPEVSGRARLIHQAASFARTLKMQDSFYNLVHFTDARYSRFTNVNSAPVVGTMHDYYYSSLSWTSSVEVRSIYEDWRVRQIYYNIIRTIEKPAILGLDGTICVSNAVQQALETDYQVDPARLAVIPHDISFPPVCPVPTGHRDNSFLFIGGNFQRKGLGILIEAAPLVLERIPQARFRIVGDSRDRRLMERRAEDLHVRQAFDFVGSLPRDDVFLLLERCAVFTMPSIIEAFGIPYIEAMHCGTPVVASNCPGPSDFLRDGWNCLAPPAGDPRQLADALVAAFYNDRLRETLATNGFTTAEKANTKTMVNQTILAYSKFRDNWQDRLDA